MSTTTPKPAEQPAAKSSIDHLQEAISEIDRARQSAQGEAREQLDRASDRLRTLAGDLRGKAGDEAHDVQSSLDRASEHLRIDLGLRAVRAQGSTDALTRLSAEIRKRKAELTS